MKKLLFSLVSLILVSQFAYAVSGDYDDDYEQIASKANLPYFVQDLGSSIGSSDFNKATIIQGLGLDVGVLASAQKTSSKNAIIHNYRSDGVLPMPTAYANIGIPYLPIEIGGRISGLADYYAIGGGAKLQLLKQGRLLPFLPNITLAGYYDTFDEKIFKFDHLSADAIISYEILFLELFGGAGVDKTELESKIDGTDFSAGYKVTEQEPRYHLGVKLEILKILYLTGSYIHMHGNDALQAGIGIRFK